MTRKIEEGVSPRAARLMVAIGAFVIAATLAQGLLPNAQAQEGGGGGERDATGGVRRDVTGGVQRDATGGVARERTGGVERIAPNILGVPLTLGQVVNSAIRLIIFGGGILLVWIIIRAAWGMIRGTTKPEDLGKTWMVVLYAALGYLALLVAWSVPRIIASFLTGGG
ncbi:MAG: hypothetical protein HY536_02025 [Candidatus Colwellbacteria bacterium]|nr:hypothetical protein [Candidatus Colwellbacteria bacterium]